MASVVRKALAEGLRPPLNLVVKAAEQALGSRDYQGVLRLVSVAPDEPGLAVLRARAAKYVGELTATEIPPGLDDDQLTDFLSGTSQGLAYAERRFGDAIRLLGEGMASVEKPENRDRLALETMVLSGLVGDLDALLGAARAVSSKADPNTRMLAISSTQLAEALTLATASSDDTFAAGMEIAGEFEVDGYLVEQMAMSRVTVHLAEGRLIEARGAAEQFEDRTLVGSWLTIEAMLADAWYPIEVARGLAEEAVAALEQFDPLANLAQSRIVADLRRAQSGDRPDGEEDALNEPGVVAIDDLMNRRVDAWLAWADQDLTAGKRLVEVGRDAIALGHRFWGLLALLDAVRLGHGDDVVADVDQLVITRGAGLAGLVGRHARAVTPDEYWAVARAWWEAGAPNYAIEAAIEAAPDKAIDRLAVHLLAAAGAQPLVGETESIECPISDLQMEIVAAVLQGEANDQVAERLFLSRRTVENHLHRVYSALDLEGGREGLRTRLGWVAQRQR